MRVPIAGLLLLGVLVGCRSYEPAPLDEAAVVAAVDRERRAAAPLEEGARGPTLAEVAEWMRRLSPELRELEGAWRIARARASVPTPLANPVLGLGPNLGFGPVVDEKHVAPFGSLSWSVPLGDRRAARDEMENAQERVAFVDLEARARELGLSFRARCLRTAVAAERVRLLEQLQKSARQSVQTARRFVQAGQATALDVTLFELELGRAHGASLEAREGLVREEEALAALVGVSSARLAGLDLEGLLATATPRLERDALRALLIDNEPELARLRARYEVSERRLRLEIEEQYPDLGIAPQLNGEPGEEKSVLTLSFSIPLPFFDRNQEAIAVAEAGREKARLDYEAEANRALARLDRARRLLSIADERRKLLEERLLPQARKAIVIARQSLIAGMGDGRTLLDAERTERELLVELQEARLGIWSYWADLEMAVGHPLVAFPETSNEAPARGEGEPNR